MADPSLDPGTGDDAGGVGPDRGSIARMPRWVKVFLIVTAVVVLLLIVLLLTSGGHGPGRHMSGGGVGGEYACHQPDQYQAGMRGKIFIT